MKTLKVSKSGKSFFFNGQQIGNVGLLPKCLESFGIIETSCETIQQFIDEELPAYEQKYKDMRAARIEQMEAYTNKCEAELEAAYNAISKNGTIEVNEENLSIVLRKLNQQNWGSWVLPKMSIGYSANQYDCDGRIATTITLDQPIAINIFEEIKMISKFKVGGTRGHLEKYHRL